MADAGDNGEMLGSRKEETEHRKSGQQKKNKPKNLKFCANETKILTHS